MVEACVPVINNMYIYKHECTFGHTHQGPNEGSFFTPVREDIEPAVSFPSCDIYSEETQ